MPSPVWIVPLLVSVLFAPPTRRTPTAPAPPITLPPAETVTDTLPLPARFRSAGVTVLPGRIACVVRAVDVDVGPVPTAPVLCATTPSEFAPSAMTEPVTLTVTLPPLP